MPWIAKQLSDADIAALAQYFGAMPAPSPLADVAPSHAAGATPRGGPPAGNTQPMQGIGTEQGSPTTGGTQGVGRATTQAVVAASILILIVNTFITRILLGSIS